MKRLQRRRTRGWRMPEGAICISRPSFWGNPHRVVRYDATGTLGPPFVWGVDGDRDPHSLFDSKREAQARAVAMFRVSFIETLNGPGRLRRILRDQLAGHDLMCWCHLCPAHAEGLPFGVTCVACDPCHGDLLGTLANAPLRCGAA